MFDIPLPERLIHAIGLTTITAPAALFFVVGLSMLLQMRLSESTIARLTQLAVLIGLIGTLMMLAAMLLTGSREVTVFAGHWMQLPSQQYEFVVKFQFDRLSVPFTVLSFVLVGVVGKFAQAYMHLEPGYHRFFLFYSMFLLGIVVSSLAGTIETLFTGWELVGLSSVFLVGFFHTRQTPVRNAVHIWSIYRITDASFLAAAVVMHHLAKSGDLSVLTGYGPWPTGVCELSVRHAAYVGGLLLIAVAGKSGLLPFLGWLPRAMEGPTPSSAIFYGALSVHLGAYLLLRISPVMDLSIWLAICVVFLGLSTAITAAIIGSVQSDIKSALAYASLTQVGLIVAEIGLGLRYLALIHIVGHACMRTLQFLRAPSLLHDYHAIESDLGEHRPNVRPWSSRLWLYRWAMERGYLDAWLVDYAVRPLLKVLRGCELFERAICQSVRVENSDGTSGAPNNRSQVQWL